MHYCSVKDLQALQQTAPRFASTFETVRNAVTAMFDSYIRRDLRYSDNVIEYHDAVAVGRGQPYYIYLDKKGIDKDRPIDIRYHADRIWDSAAVVSGATVDHVKGKITLYGPLRFTKDGIRISYAGGYKASEDDEEVMDCPAELKMAAIAQAQYNLKELLDSDAGHRESDRGRNVLTKEKTVQGIILPAVRILDQYRKPLARVI